MARGVAGGEQRLSTSLIPAPILHPESLFTCQSGQLCKQKNYTIFLKSGLSFCNALDKIFAESTVG